MTLYGCYNSDLSRLHVLHGFIFHRKMDRDRDGKISFQDFNDTVARQPLLMEAFGECLPYNKGKYSQISQFSRSIL